MYKTTCRPCKLTPTHPSCAPHKTIYTPSKHTKPPTRSMSKKRTEKCKLRKYKEKITHNALLALLRSRYAR
ncbi:hypothetical protein EJ05DRAFT_374249 [Pseudovirgaria hyperparasitica]|uniref:Uncharacterized protein n=1 Tax=Pseudovirgaria hyperparasitica TaxID=470096 RepID=A0A6A6W511_9PEZI|nr:uncharacterized protein EJ05DRAFT_374249 [Pseudovirgaria hyperparasitica]KAF2758018.1 hypothetical protein EJ05DRAFT_374249 [Pseudovirgaria hyperparasitica]